MEPEFVFENAGICERNMYVYCFIDNVNTVAVGKLKNENYQHLQNSYFDYCEN